MAYTKIQTTVDADVKTEASDADIIQKILTAKVESLPANFNYTLGSALKLAQSLLRLYDRRKDKTKKSEILEKWLKQSHDIPQSLYVFITEIITPLCTTKPGFAKELVEQIVAENDFAPKHALEPRWTPDNIESKRTKLVERYIQKIEKWKKAAGAEFQQIRKIRVIKNEIQAYYALLNDAVIKKFFDEDQCHRESSIRGVNAKLFEKNSSNSHLELMLVEESSFLPGAISDYKGEIARIMKDAQQGSHIIWCSIESAKFNDELRKKTSINFIPLDFNAKPEAVNQGLAALGKAFAEGKKIIFIMSNAFSSTDIFLHRDVSEDEADNIRIFLQHVNIIYQMQELLKSKTENKVGLEKDKELLALLNQTNSCFKNAYLEILAKPSLLVIHQPKHTLSRVVLTSYERTCVRMASLSVSSPKPLTSSGGNSLPTIHPSPISSSSSVIEKQSEAKPSVTPVKNLTYKRE